MVGVRRFPRAGVVVARSSPTADSPWVLLRAGRPALAHGHQDALALEVFHGRPRLVDPGISSYSPGAMTAHYRAAEAHNMPRLDGRRPEPLPGHPLVRRRGDVVILAARGEVAGQGLVSRRAVLVGHECCLVHDAAWGMPGNHRLSLGWQCFPGRWRWDPGKARLSGGAGFELILLAARPAGEPDVVRGRGRPPRGWVALAGRDRPAPHLGLELVGPMPLQAWWLIAFRPGWTGTVETEPAGGWRAKLVGPGGAGRTLESGPPGGAEPWPRVIQSA